jgi:hypothetical protein
MDKRKKALHAPIKKSTNLPNLVYIIEQKSPIGYRSVEDALIENNGKEVLIRDASILARGINGYLAGVIASKPINGEYEFQTRRNKVLLKCYNLTDMLTREKN